MCSFSLIHTRSSLFASSCTVGNEYSDSQPLSLSRCRLFSSFKDCRVLKRGRKVLRLKDKHPSYCGSAVYLFLCVPTSLLQTDRTKQQSPCCPADCQSLRVFADCSLVDFGFLHCDSFECSPPRCLWGGDYTKTSVECLVANIRCRDSVCRRRRLVLQLKE